MSDTLSPPPLTVGALGPRPLKLQEVADAYARPLSFVESWYRSGRLRGFEIGPGLDNARIPWSEVVEKYCGMPAVFLEHPDDSDHHAIKADAPPPENPAEMRRKRVTGDVVYFVEGVGVGVVKIGYADDPRKRFRGLYTMSPVPVRLLALMPGPIAVERELHARFKTDRRHGEWFALSPRLKRFIKQQRSLYGLPDWALS